ncbi:MAG TPA: helix-turn-helix transcriptional regulator [Streptosporangiaceae bacterium]
MPESQTPGPVVLRIRLGATLRRLREARGITAQRAAEAIRASDSKISRIELGRHGAREIDVSDLLTLYGVTDTAEREQLLQLASDALARPWWRGHADILPVWFQTYLGLEEAAETLQSYDTHFVPGLLQTADYAAALLADFTKAEIARFLNLRSQRTGRFAAGGGRLAAVIDEAVLRRPVGGKDVFAAQLEYLAEAARRRAVTIRIRPFTAGAPPCPSGFTILRFADETLPDAVYTEQLTSASYVDRPADVSRYAAMMELLVSTSKPASQTAAMIEDALARIG